MSRVYVLTDEAGRIVRIEGEYTLPEDLTGWVMIEEGESCERLNLAQTQYLPGGLYTGDGICRWKLENGAPVPRGSGEIAADWASVQPVVVPPTNTELAEENDRLRAQIAMQAEHMTFLEDCLLELGDMVYA